MNFTTLVGSSINTSTMNFTTLVGSSITSSTLNCNNLGGLRFSTVVIPPIPPTTISTLNSTLFTVPANVDKLEFIVIGAGGGGGYTVGGGGGAVNFYISSPTAGSTFALYPGLSRPYISVPGIVFGGKASMVFAVSNGSSANSTFTCLAVAGAGAGSNDAGNTNPPGGGGQSKGTTTAGNQNPLLAGKGGSGSVNGSDFNIQPRTTTFIDVPTTTTTGVNGAGGVYSGYGTGGGDGYGGGGSNNGQGGANASAGGGMFLSTAIAVPPFPGPIYPGTTYPSPTSPGIYNGNNQTPGISITSSIVSGIPYPYGQGGNQTTAVTGINGVIIVNITYTTTLTYSTFCTPIRNANSIGNMLYNPITTEITYTVSMEKYKKNIIDLSLDTTSIYNLIPREYDYISDGSHCVGFIAEEVDKIDTMLSAKNSDGTPGNINWFGLTTYLVNELKKMNERLKAIEDKDLKKLT